MHIRYFFSAVACISIVLCQSAAAITIDALNDGASASSSSAVGIQTDAYVPSTTAIGGGRTLSVVKTSASPGVTRLEIDAHSIGYTQGSNAGRGVITWDGDTDPHTTNPTGLGAVDMTQDGGTAFRFGLFFFDYPAGLPIRISLRIYDSREPAGTRFSEVAFTLDHVWSGPEIFLFELPFALFEAAGTSSIGAPNGQTYAASTTVGSAGPADITSIGAISLTFDGASTRAIDLFLSTIATNGRCEIVTNENSSVLDECGVCFNDPSANLGRDRCNVCRAGPSGYSYESNKTLDGCSLCPGETNYAFPEGAKDECGVCLGGPSPYAYADPRDACGVCAGTAISSNECTPPPVCVTTPPTQQIRTFESRLLEKATVLRNRFNTDLIRWTRNSCGASPKIARRNISKAFGRISSRGRAIFQKGIEVCGDSCVTVSYANEVRSLSVEFKTLEREAAALANGVKRCYKQRGIAPSGGGRGQTVAQTIAAVRAGLDRLVSDCRRSRVCAGHSS